MFGMQWTNIKTLLVPVLALLIIKASSVLGNDEQLGVQISNLPCPRALAVPMIEGKIIIMENESLLYEGYIYPREYYWRDDKTNLTLGCICNLGVRCFRKCCYGSKILHKNATCVDAEVGTNGSDDKIKDLIIPENNLTPDIRNMTKLDEHFYVLKNRICPNDVFILEPEIIDEDEFVVDSKGLLTTKQFVFSPERYCIDWQIYTNEIRVVVCFPEEEQEITTMASTLEMKLYPVGMIISIPFMIATLSVYGTIPELRNLYGKTLMCYVACLIYAYSALAVLQLANVTQFFCVSFGAKKFENGSLYFKDQLFPPEFFWTNDTNIYGCPCELGGKPCIRTCCSPGEEFNGSGCIVPKNYTVNPIRLPDENLAPEIRTLKKLEDAFYTVPNMQCPNNTRYALEPDDFPEDKYVLHYNGTLTTELQTFGPKQYCIGSSGIDQNIIIAICFDEEAADSVQMPVPMLYPIGMMASIPFLLATVIVYAIIPELRNLYGKTLMCYVSSLVTAYILLTVAQFDPAGDMPLVICILTAFTIHFSFLASFFWLNVMCFDIWWTFGGFRSLQGSIKQRERKKFLMYSIYAWGCAILLTAVCVIMDFVPGIPEDVLRPEFGSERCWFRTEKAKALYFYGPMGVTVFCNIILFISTAAKIIRHKKDTAHHLKGTDSKRHDDNKQWFNLYLKLFIVMGINWSMEIISWLCQGPKYLWYLTDIANTLQGVIIFIIFVWKDKIKRLLIKRFDCKGPKFLSRDSTRSTAYHSSTSRTCTTSIPLHEKTNSFPDPVSRIKPASDDSDGV